jgi:hypothetical protein
MWLKNTYGICVHSKEDTWPVLLVRSRWAATYNFEVLCCGRYSNNMHILLSRRLITVFTRICISAIWIQSIPSHLISFWSVLVLSSHLHWGLPHGLFSSILWTEDCVLFSYPPSVLHSWTIPASFIWILSNVCWWVGVHIMKLLIMHIFSSLLLLSLL